MIGLIARCAYIAQANSKAQANGPYCISSSVLQAIVGKANDINSTQKSRRSRPQSSPPRLFRASRVVELQT